MNVGRLYACECEFRGIRLIKIGESTSKYGTSRTRYNQKNRNTGIAYGREIFDISFDVSVEPLKKYEQLLHQFLYSCNLKRKGKEHYYYDDVMPFVKKLETKLNTKQINSLDIIVNFIEESKRFMNTDDLTSVFMKLIEDYRKHVTLDEAVKKAKAKVDFLFEDAEFRQRHEVATRPDNNQKTSTVNELADKIRNMLDGTNTKKTVKDSYVNAVLEAKNTGVLSITKRRSFFPALTASKEVPAYADRFFENPQANDREWKLKSNI